VLEVTSARSLHKIFFDRSASWREIRAGAPERQIQAFGAPKRVVMTFLEREHAVMMQAARARPR